MKKKRIKLPEPFTIKIVNDDGTPVLDESGKQRVQVFNALTFARNEMTRSKAFSASGPLGLAAWCRIEDAIMAAMESKAEHYDVYEEDYAPFLAAVNDPPEGKYFAQEVIGPHVMMRFVNPWLKAEDVPEPVQEAAE